MLFSVYERERERDEAKGEENCDVQPNNVSPRRFCNNKRPRVFLQRNFECKSFTKSCKDHKFVYVLYVACHGQRKYDLKAR